MKYIKPFLSFFVLAIVLTIVFVKAGKGGGKSGGEQASMIIAAGTKGVADIIKATMGE